MASSGGVEDRGDRDAGDAPNGGGRARAGGPDDAAVDARRGGHASRGPQLPARALRSRRLAHRPQRRTRRGQRGHSGRGAERRRLRDPDRRPHPGAGSPPAPTRCPRCSAAGCGFGASAARRSRSAASPRTRAPRARQARPAGRRRPALPLAPLRDRPGVDPRAQLHGSATSWSARAAASWTIAVEDGKVSCERGLDEEPRRWCGSATRTGSSCCAGELNPTDSMRLGLTELTGAIPPVTLMGRWIDRAEGVDGPELEREARQRRVQAERAGAWGSPGTARATAPARTPATPARPSRAGARAG